MASVELSDKAQQVLRRIRKRFKIGFEPFRVKDIELQILKVTDLEHLLAGKDPFADVSAFPFWIKLWEAAMMLSGIMASMEHDSKRRVLELGAGLGVPGLVAAARGGQVTISDYEPHILDFQRVSAAASGLENIEFRMIDWKNPPEMPRFDMIVGAEILFRDEFFQPLLDVFDRYLAPDGIIYLSHDSRRKSVPKFLEVAKKDYEIAVMSRKMRSEDGEITILINRLKRR